MKSLSQMTEEELKTLCKSLESRYGENSTVTIKQSDFNNMWASIDRYAKENKCLQKQLKEANEVIQKDFDSFDYIHSHIGSNQSNYNALMSATSYAISDIRKYKKKWGVK